MGYYRGGRRKKLSVRACTLIALAFLAIAIVALGLLGAMVWSNHMADLTYSTIAEQSRNMAKNATESSTSDDNGESGDKSLASPDEALEIAQRRWKDAVGWIQVPNLGIDLPVYQGQDNEYYLYHDGDGNPSYAAIFADYRCDVAGPHVNIYGHTLISGGMFTSLAHALTNSGVSSIGDAYFTTVDGAVRRYSVVCGTKVSAANEQVQQFEFSAKNDEYNAAKNELMEEKRAAGAWTLEVCALDPRSMDLLPEDAFLTSIEARPNANGGMVNWSRYYAFSDEDLAEIDRRASLLAQKRHLRTLTTQADAVNPQCGELINNMEHSLSLICCSFPDDFTRTVITFVSAE